MDLQKLKDKINELENKNYDKHGIQIFMESVFSYIQTEYPDIVNKFSTSAFENFKSRTYQSLLNSKNFPQTIISIDDLITKLERLTNENQDELRINFAKTLNMPLETLEKDIVRAKKLQIIPGHLTISENKKLAMDALIKFTDILNSNNIEYTIVGALPCYLQGAGEIIRYHDDIDILIQDKDIDKLKSILKRSKDKNYQLVDDRKQSKAILKGFDNNGKPIIENGGNHEVYLQHANSEFHVGFFLYDKKEDHYETKRYYIDEKTNKPISLIEHTISSKDWQSENSGYIELKKDKNKKIKIPCCTIKSVYNKKFYIKDYNGKTRPKDEFDKQMFETFCPELKQNAETQSSQNSNL